MGHKSLPRSQLALHSNLSEPFRPLKNTEARFGGTCFLENNKMKYLRVDLKVCEGCGALWLRTGVLDGVYCLPCSGVLSSFPEARRKRPGGRPRNLGPVSARCASRRGVGGVQ